MPLTDSALNSQALVIKNETIVKANTAIRVGTMLQDIIDNKINNDKISTDAALGTSNTLVPSQAAVRTYVNGRTINDVLTAGRIATITPLFPNVEFGTISSTGNLSFSANTYTFVDATPNDIFSVKDSEVNIFSNTGAIIAKIASSALTQSRTFNLPNKSGTIALTSDIPTGLPTKVFIASISQSGSDNAPEVNYVIKNTFDDDITFGVFGNGFYTINSAGSEFTTNKTMISISNGINVVLKFVGVSPTSSSSATIETYNSSGVAADNLLNNDIIKIEVYS